MDLATIGGLAVTTILILASIMIGSPLMVFWNLPSVLMVVLGSISIMFVCFPSSHCKNALLVVRKALFVEVRNPEQVLQLMREMSARARREGCLLYTSPSPRDATLSRMPSSA